VSLLDAVTAGLGFRSRTPSFAPGEEFDAVVTGTADGQSVVRIGDSRLRVVGTNGTDQSASVAPDTWVRLRVRRFDEESAVGEAELVEVLEGES
jgi:hypothetical protein